MAIPQGPYYWPGYVSGVDEQGRGYFVQAGPVYCKKCEEAIGPTSEIGQPDTDSEAESNRPDSSASVRREARQQPAGGATTWRATITGGCDTVEQLEAARAAIAEFVNRHLMPRFPRVGAEFSSVQFVGPDAQALSEAYWDGRPLYQNEPK